MIFAASLVLSNTDLWITRPIAPKVMRLLSDERIVFEEYFNLNNQGFGTYYAMPPRAPRDEPAFGPAA